METLVRTVVDLFVDIARCFLLNFSLSQINKMPPKKDAKGGAKDKGGAKGGAKGGKGASGGDDKGKLK